MKSGFFIMSLWTTISGTQLEKYIDVNPKNGFPTHDKAKERLIKVFKRYKQASGRKQDESEMHNTFIIMELFW